MQVPVILGFGWFEGGNRYRVQFEVFAEKIELPRRGREAAIKVYAQRYAQRLEYYARLAPYNWFNFYDYWQVSPAQDSANDSVNDRSYDSSDKSTHDTAAN